MKLFSTFGKAASEQSRDTTPQDKPVKKPLKAQRLANCKRAFTTRRANLDLATKIITSGIRPQSGDLVLARVSRLGQHQKLELPNGRRARMYVGDEIIVAYGNRYATDQFEALIPDHLGPCNLVAAGGIASTALSRAKNMRRATEIEPVGLLATNDGTVLNLSQFALPDAPAMQAPRPLVLAVVGTSMNAGKTTSAADIIRGLRSSDLKVSAAKVTGTGAGGDYWHFTDSGAHEVVDFTDVGISSTYMMENDAVITVMNKLVCHLNQSSPDVIVIEVADGLLQRETRPLLESAAFKNLVDGVFFATPDALSAMAGVAWLSERGMAPIALCGMVTKSDINAQEARDATGLPVMTTEMLSNGDILTPIAFKARKPERKGKVS